MEKLSYLVVGSPVPAPERLEEVGRPAVEAARRLGAGAISLLIPDHTEILEARAPRRLSPTFRDASLLLQVWLPSLDERAAVEAVLRPAARELWGYLVSESTVQPEVRDVVDGERIPGITQVTLNEKPEGVSDEDFYREWQEVHSKHSFALHPTRASYERNAVARRLTTEAPDHRALVLERFPRLEDFVDDSIYFGDPEVLAEMVRHVPSFYRFDTAVTGGMSEYWFR